MSAKNIGLISLIALLVMVVSYAIFTQKTDSPTNGPALTTILPAQTITTPGTKLYRNEEWGFEFEYPEDWTFEVNSFFSPYSKFNLQGNSSAPNYNSLIPPFLVNVVTSDFIERQFSDIENIASEVSVGGAVGLKYEYEEQHGSYKVSNMIIILPLDQHKIILGAHKKYENIFNQILASFKFVKPEIKFYRNEE